ncbi:MAG: asparagine synthase (glutamine-hydrolyzing) [Verrucomicrobia bacterium]|jgi:asparagine synthase (glutamine-hydrolysing)|nr:asparagine synthase (glutamine-hydrolyzing) [Verrucomicrobiota bacterium]
MCGIAGVIHFGEKHEAPSASLIKQMVSTLQHRGPDEFGMYRDHYAGVGHARLSLIDLKMGQQPLCNETGDLWISYNGEIFNYIELRERLEARGHLFRTHSDTEVIVHAYEEWGDACFSRFNGQWAISLWDAKRRRLTLSRDRMGIRPLYVHAAQERICFASEVKALFSDPEVPRELDLRGLAQTFSYWGPVAPTTVFRGIEELPPASVRVYEADGSHREHIFWSPAFPESQPVDAYPLSLAEATEALREKLDRASRLRAMRSDVPVGSYLSGGLDSAVTAWMGRQAKAGDFRTFSLRFKDAEFDETRYQRQMAERLDSHHEEVEVSREDIAAVFPTVVEHTERPVLRTAPAPMFLLSKLVRESGIKSVLTGEGADEVLAGYDIFREAKIRRFWAREPESVCRPQLFDRLYPYLARAPQQTKGMAQAFWKQGLAEAGTAGFSHGPRWKTTASIQRFFGADAAATLAAAPPADVLASLPSAFHGWSPLAQDQFLEIATLFGPYLISSQGDRMLMANSVEGRFPFLDIDVMEFCNGLPPSYKLRVLDEKHILKRVARDIVPPEILTRKKQPYRAPDAISFVSDTAPEYVAEVLSDTAVTRAGIFDPRKVQGLHAKLRKRAAAGGDVVFSNADNMAFVGVLSTQLLVESLTRPTSGPDSRFSDAFATVIDRTL